MVEYAGDDAIFEEEMEEQIGFPKTLPSSFFPEKPMFVEQNAADYFLPFLLDEASYLKKYATPKLTDEQIEAAYEDTDFKTQRKSALAKFGFGLLRPTAGGRIGESLSAAGAQLASDLSSIKTSQQIEAKKNAQAKITAQIERDAQNILEKKGIYDTNRSLLVDIAGKNYESQIKNNDDLMAIYKTSLAAAQSKFMDFQLEGVKPKRVQVAFKGENGDIGIPFDAFVVQNLLDDGSLSSPQYYKPGNTIGSDGLPIMELIENPENIVSVPLSMTGTADDFKTAKGLTTFRDVLSGLQTTDRALLTLDELAQSFLERPGRAGFIAGIKGRFQTYAQIFSDLYGEQFNGFFSDDDLVQFNNQEALVYETGKYKGQKMEKMQNMASTIALYLQDPNVQADIQSGKIGKEEIAALESASKVFDQLGATGYAQMKVEARGGLNIYGEALFKGTDGRTAEQEKELIFKKLRFFDTDLPANQVRANSIIYAIARARKSSGRLNLDDIERAAKDLNIYGDSSADVLSKIGVLRTQLERSREDALGQIQIMFGSGKDNFYDKLIEMGYASYDRNRSLADVTNPEGSGYIDPSRTDIGDVKFFDYKIGVE
jgi:hypothetical protein